MRLSLYLYTQFSTFPCFLITITILHRHKHDYKRVRDSYASSIIVVCESWTLKRGKERQSWGKAWAWGGWKDKEGYNSYYSVSSSSFLFLPCHCFPSISPPSLTLCCLSHLVTTLSSSYIFTVTIFVFLLCFCGILHFYIVILFFL